MRIKIYFPVVIGLLKKTKASKHRKRPTCQSQGLQAFPVSLSKIMRRKKVSFEILTPEQVTTRCNRFECAGIKGR